MFDTLVERPTVWDVLAGRVDPGPVAMAALRTVDPMDQSPQVRAELATAWDAQRGWTEAQCLTAVHALASPDPVTDPGDPVTVALAEAAAAEEAAQADAPYRRSPVWIELQERLKASLVPGSPAAERVVTEQVRLALGSSESYATQRVWFARTLTTRLTVTKRLLEEGRITGYHALIAAEESNRLSDEECLVLEDRIYPRGETETVAKFRRSTRRVVAALHPQDLERDHAQAKKNTDVTRWVEDHGMASLRLHAPAPVITEVWEAVNTEAHAQARAAKRAGEERIPIGERRVAVFTRLARTSDAHLRGLGITRDGVDAFDPAQDDRDPEDVTALIAEQLSDGTNLDEVSEPASPEQLELIAAKTAIAPQESTPGEGSQPACVNPLRLPMGPAAQVQVGVVIDLDVLLGARDGPAILQGYGPIPSSMARQLAADATWRRVLLEPVEGWLLDYGRTRYQPPTKLRDHLLGLGQDCRAPYCNARPKETDHGTDWANGGATSAENMNGMCKHTHYLKTFDTFTITNNPDQSLTWTTPAGNTYTKPPDDLRITDYGLKPEAPPGSP